MKWIFKAAVQHVLGRLPAPVADPAYHAIQRAGRAIPMDISGQRAFLAQSAAFVEDICGGRLEGMSIVELGSGWHPVLPLLATREFDAAKVHTFDVNRHYSRARVAQTAQELMKCSDRLAADPVLQRIARTANLPDCVHYYPRCKIQSLRELPGGPAHLALSRSVLEYATPDEICDIHAASLRWLAPGALWVHLVGTSDDRARQDKALNKFDFLRYSEHEWLRISGNRYAYKNRLRLPQYRALFKSVGWRVVRDLAIVSETALAEIREVPLHPDFAQLSAQDLVAGSIYFALTRSEVSGYAAR